MTDFLAAKKIIEMLALEPLLEEGGMFKSTYRTSAKIDGKDIGSAIYYFLSGNAFSHMHRLMTDEVYHFYIGSPVELLELYADGSSRRVVLGHNIGSGQMVQTVVKAGAWQGLRIIDGGSYALMGTTMSPGYSPGDYEHGNADYLIRKYPECRELIEKLTGELIYQL